MEITIYIGGLDPNGQILAAAGDAAGAEHDTDTLASQERHGGNGTIEIEIDKTITAKQLDTLKTVIENAGATVTAFGPGPYVSATEIANRIGRTPQNVLQLSAGQRGPGSFPTPINPGQRGSLWIWHDVSAWLAAVAIPTIGTDQPDTGTNVIIGNINDEIRNTANHSTTRVSS